MASPCVGPEEHEEVWEATHGRAVISFGPIISLPVVIQASIAAHDVHEGRELVCFETRC